MNLRISGDLDFQRHGWNSGDFGYDFFDWYVDSIEGLQVGIYNIEADAGDVPDSSEVVEFLTPAGLEFTDVADKIQYWIDQGQKPVAIKMTKLRFDIAAHGENLCLENVQMGFESLALVFDLYFYMNYC